MARRRRLHKRYGSKRKRNPETSSRPRANPPLLQEVAEFIGPGFAAFAATRMLTRMAAVQIAKRKPSWAKHAGVLASLGSFAAAWLGAHRVKMLEKYQTPLMVGAGIAALQSMIQLYIPSLGWMISDSTPEIGDATANALPATVTQQQQIAAAQLQPVNEDPAWYTYDDKYDAGRYAKETAATPPQTAAAPKSQVQKEEDLLADLNLDDDSGGSANMGIFSN